LSFRIAAWSGERDVLPRGAGGVARAPYDLEPGGFAELRVLAAVVERLERTLGEVADREVGDRIPIRLEEQDGVVALHHAFAAGVGFTASPLIASHAFHGALLDQAKVGILATALLAPALAATALAPLRRPDTAASVRCGSRLPATSPCPAR
jgi:hypothetical protein